MNPAAKTQPELSDAEWDLIAELLEQERSELAPEIRRTRTPAMRDDLRRRLELVESLLKKLPAR
ncbi:MAG TPA: hypothetical protein PLA43_11765 [Bryobacteraceae bacterium]|nr:hypothetical protein [Bryobacteraceae bacterium]HOL70984.1 hypothetical protein [Bryobacteraceae bacterium]HOQ46467.1 hypothetical protein [Bryobacteraceae bacterium]HPQ17461.1 hypothetical protein [Bryobacteraceae bacterium]HPU72626.1 hypothetical protein [Bryobacteraceae bacterium]